MSRLFYHVTQDSLGNLLFDVSGTMRIAGSGTLATIYGDEGLTVIIPNPMTNHPSFGSFKCFLPNGDYDFYMAKPGYTFETLTGVQGHGTMAQQDAANVAITGGNITGLSSLHVAGNTGLGTLPTGQKLQVAGPATFEQQVQVVGTALLQNTAQIDGHVGIGTAPTGQALQVVGATTLQALQVTGALTVSGMLTGGQATLTAGPQELLLADGAGNPFYGLRGQVSAGTGKANLYCDGTAPNFLLGPLHAGAFAAAPFAQITVRYPKAGLEGIRLQPTDSDTGTPAVQFVNLAGTVVGSITTTGAATAYNTSSDARLKEDIEPLSGALDVVRALNPVAFRWKADGSLGQGLIAQEVQQIVPGVVSDTDMLGIDYSKLVPWLTAALQETLAQVQALTARVASLETQLVV